MTKKIFGDIKSYEDFKNALTTEENIDIFMNCYAKPENIEAAIVAINSFSENQQKFILKYLHHVDSEFNVSKKDTNIYHKIPVVIAGCIFYHQFYNQVKDLTCDELGILAKFAATDSVSDYNEITEIFNKNLLSTIARKTPIYGKRDEIAFLAYGKIKSGQNRESMIKYIAGAGENDLIKESSEYQIQKNWRGWN